MTPIRRALGFRTIFNVLGPLANPALVERSLIGVAQPDLLGAMAQVLRARGIQHAILVHADDGLDELSLGAPSTLHVITPDGVDVQRLNAPEELSLHHDVTELRGGGIEQNVNAVRVFLDATPGAVFDVACANAGLALVVAGVARNLREGFERATTSVESGAAAVALERLVAVSRS